MSNVSTPDILAKIVADKQQRLKEQPVQALTSAQRSALTPIGPQGGMLAQNLRRPGLNIVAEIKRKSPSAGPIAQLPEPALQADAYIRGGAAGISVLTEQDHFGGSITDLTEVTSVVTIPVLRKDFMVDPIQFEEAARAGANVVLLIAAILEPVQAWEFHELAAELGLETIFEIHSEAEYEPFSHCDWPIIGVNNRNLHVFETDLSTTERLVPQLPQDALKISESGFHHFDDFVRIGDIADGFLVGESLSRADNPTQTLQQWCEKYGNS